MNQIPKGTTGIEYEALFNKYLSEKRDHDVDFVTFANCLKTECKSNLSARQIMTFARRVLEDHGVKIKNVTNRNLKREMKGSAGTVDRVMTAKVIEAAMAEMDVKGRALVLTLASSGARLNEILSMKLSDVDFNSTPVKLTLRRTKNQNIRFTFISGEAARCMKAWIGQREKYMQGAAGRVAGLVRAGICNEKDTNSDLVFPFSDAAANQIWETALKASGQFSQDDQTGRNQLRIHSFRKFFISQLSMAGQKVLAEHLAGHEGYLDGSYRRIDEEQAAREYLKVQHVITIGVPEEFREKATEMNGKLQIQGESIDGLRAVNEKLQHQIRKQQAQMDTVQAQMAALISTLKEAGFSKVQLIDINSLPDATGVQE